MFAMPILASLLATIAQVSPHPVPPAPSAGEPTTIRATVVRSTDIASIPIEYAEDRIVFKAELGGQPVWMLLDTGAGHSVIDEGLARRLGLPILTGKGSYSSIGGHALAAHYVADVALVIPHALSGRVPMATTDLGGVGNAGHPIGGVLGIDLLSRTTIVIHRTAGEMLMVFAANAPMKFTAPAGFRGTPPAPIVTTLRDGRLRLVVSVDGTPLELTVDTGSSRGLSLSPAAWDRVRPKDAQVFARLETGASGIADRVSASRLPEIRVGQAIVRDADVIVQDQLAGDGDGTIGMGILSRYSLVIDPSHDQMYLIPEPASSAALPAPVVESRK